MSMAAKVIDRSNSVSDAEWEQRVDLAAVYRVFARMGYDDLIFTHISARIPGPEHHFLINPFGLMYGEVTASSLVKIDLDGNKVDPDEPNDINHAGYIIHSAVHGARDDARCVIHLHTDHGVAVSAQKDGLRPISQYNLFQAGNIGYHDYEGVALDEDEQPRLVADLGTRNVMILRNHGTLSVGRTVGEAFLHMYNLERACRIQILAQAGGTAALKELPDEIVQSKIYTTPKSDFMVEMGDRALAAWQRKLDREEPDYRH